MTEPMKINDWKPGIQLLTGIDDEYVSEALSAPARKSANLKWLYAAAACIAVVAAAFTAAHFIKKPDNGVSALIPIVPSQNPAVAETALPVEATEHAGEAQTQLPGPSSSIVPDVSAYPVVSAGPTDYAAITAAPTVETEAPLITEDADPTFTPIPGVSTPAPTAAPTATPKATATPKPTNTPKPTATPKPTNTPKPWSPTPPPGPYPSSHLFFSEEEFMEAILSGDEYYTTISWVTHYYKPANIPQGCSFHFIGGDRSSVYLRYECNASGSLQGFNFCWYPEKDPYKVADYAYVWCYEGSPYQVEEYHGCYIIRQPDWYIWEVWWTQDGQVFYAKFWDGFSYELVDTVCDARLVPIR